MGQKILVVEDNELNLKLFCDLLRAHGFEAEPVRDGREAVERARAFMPDLVVMDIQMPYVSGLELIEQMKADDDLRRTPIMAVTAYAARGDEERIRDAGAEGYVSKPISVMKFVASVEGLLEAAERQSAAPEASPTVATAVETEAPPDAADAIAAVVEAEAPAAVAAALEAAAESAAIEAEVEETAPAAEAAAIEAATEAEKPDEPAPVTPTTEGQSDLFGESADLDEDSPETSPPRHPGVGRDPDGCSEEAQIVETEAPPPGLPEEFDAEDAQTQTGPESDPGEEDLDPGRNPG